MNIIKVLVVDDHPVARAGLRTMLEACPDIQVVGEASDGFEAVEQTVEHQPQVVLMDLQLPNLNGMEATRRITRRFAATAVLILTVDDQNAYVVDAFRAGATGFLTKDAPQELILHTIRAVHNGGALLQAGLMRQILATLADAQRSNPSRCRATGDTWISLPRGSGMSCTRWCGVVATKRSARPSSSVKTR